MGGVKVYIWGLFQNSAALCLRGGDGTQHIPTGPLSLPHSLVLLHCPAVPLSLPHYTVARDGGGGDKGGAPFALLPPFFPLNIR